MGPYCQYCDHRCFVSRSIPSRPGTLLMATCAKGAEHDLRVTGYDYHTARNPLPACGACGEPARYTIIRHGEPVPACLRHLNHWRTPQREA